MKKISTIAFGIGLCAMTLEAWAWGPISHRMVTETAALLVEKSLADSWGPLVSKHRFELGYYSLAPDSVYRHKDGHDGKMEAPTHFLDLDVLFGSLEAPATLSKKIKSIPLEYKKTVATFEKTLGKEKTLAAGSAPWRVEQFLKLAKDSLKDVKTVQGGYQPGKKATGETRQIFVGLYHLGILSHFTGDVTMPYHVTHDWNGWDTGEGGIHFFIEFDCVNFLDPGLATEVLEAAVKNKKDWLKDWGAPNKSAVSLTLQVLRDSAAALQKLQQIDKEHAILKPSAPGTRENALRKKPQEACPDFRPLLVERLAKGAVFTAHVWEMALPKNVDFSKGTALQFSDIDGDPTYIPPDYLP